MGPSVTDAPTRLRNFSTPCALGNSLCAVAHASVKFPEYAGTTAAITRVFDEVSFSCFTGTSGVVVAPLSVLLDANFLKTFGTGMSEYQGKVKGPQFKVPGILGFEVQ